MDILVLSFRRLLLDMNTYHQGQIYTLMENLLSIIEEVQPCYRLKAVIPATTEILNTGSLSQLSPTNSPRIKHFSKFMERLIEVLDDGFRMNEN